MRGLVAGIAFRSGKRLSCRMPGIEYHYNEAYGLELVLSDGAERRWPRHIHVTHWVAGLVLAGTAVLETREATRRLEAGDSFAVPPGESHGLCVSAGSSLVVLCVRADKAGADFLGRLGVLATENVVAHATAVGTPDEDCPGAPVERLARPVARGDGLGGRLADSLGAVVRLLVEQPERSLSVVEMAGLAGCGPRQFLRRFRSEVGMTPHAFQIACRLRKARRMLRSGVPAAEAAASAGFTDQSHMHKILKDHHGLTPRRFVRAGRLIR